jgi:hypothetical protein
MLPYQQAVGKQEDWANVVTNVAMINTPFMAWLPMGKQPAQAEFLYQAETYKQPSRNSHPDGAPVTGATSAGDQRVQLRSLIQYFTKAANVSKLTQDYGNNAAVADELGTEIRKQTKELSNDMEAACLSLQECRIGVSGTTGYMWRGVPNWVQNSAQAVYPVDASQYPDATQISTTGTGSLTEDLVLNILQGIGNTTQSNETVTAFCAPNLRRAFNNFPMFIPASGTTINAGAYPQPIKGGAFDRGIIRYVTPFGFEVDLVTSWRNYKLDANGNPQSGLTQNNYSGLFCHQSKWEFRWGNKPTWTQKPYEGGKYEAFCESIAQLVCWTPKGEGIYAPTGA